MPRRPLPPQQRNQLRTRIRSARNLGNLIRFDFLAFGVKGNLEAVHCRICGSILRGLVEDESFEETKVIGSQTVVTKRMVMATLPLYTELRIILDNQQAYDVAMCSPCVNRVQVPDLEEIFAAELNAFQEIETREAQSPDWEKIRLAIPVAFERDR